MTVNRSESIPVRSQEDVVAVRQRVRAVAAEEGFRLVDQTKLVTAASELARNTYIYDGGGAGLIEIIENGGRKGDQAKKGKGYQGKRASGGTGGIGAHASRRVQTKAARVAWQKIG